MLDLATALSSLPEGPGDPPWPGHEYVQGRGVLVLPFDSGHVLALRVFPENDFSPYRSLWYRDPEGRWSIHVDGERLDTACPPYFGPACTTMAHAQSTGTGEPQPEQRRGSAPGQRRAGRRPGCLEDPQRRRRSAP